MTGFGRAEGKVGEYHLAVEVQAVNRRNLEIQSSLPREWQFLEKGITRLFKGRAARGRITIQLSALAENQEGGLVLDDRSLDAALESLRTYAEKRDIPWKPDEDILLRLATSLKSESHLPDAETLEDPALEIVVKAADHFIRMREEEGEALRQDLEARLGRLRDYEATVQKFSREGLGHYREQLFQRLSQAGLELDLDDERVLREIAIFADRCDISEELTRLGSHFDQMAECLSPDLDDPVGRKLEFILQEVHREFNTIGSKSNHIQISRAVIEAKNELERIREQIQNIE